MRWKNGKLYLIISGIALCGWCASLLKNQLSHQAIWEQEISQDGKNKIESICKAGEGPDLYLNYKRITENECELEFNPVVNNAGDYAYAEFSGSTTVSKVILNDIELFAQGTLCQNLKITDQFLVFTSLDRSSDMTTLYVYSLKDKTLKKMDSIPEKYVREIKALNNRSFAVNTIKNGMGGGTIYILDAQEHTMTPCLKDEGVILFPYVDKNLFFVDTVKIDGNINYLFNAWYWYYRYQSQSPFSYSNDFCGRLSWNQSGRMDGMLKLYQKSGDAEIKEALKKEVEQILQTRNGKIGIKGNYNPEYLWASRIYSLEREAISLLVNNCIILETLLEVANEGLLDDKIYQEVIKTAEQGFNYYDQFYKDGHYYVPYGSPFYLDGSIVPWNWQNAMGLVSLELYKATGKQKYKERSQNLMQKFQSEWIVSEQDIVWHYWPIEFYEGWSDEDMRSKHTPAQPKTEDMLLEDVTHAGINVKFCLKYYDLIADDVVNRSQLMKIQKTMERFCGKDGFSGFISGDTEHQVSSYLSLVSPYWSNFYNKNYCDFLRYIHPPVYPEFDMQIILYSYANTYIPQEGEKLTVNRKLYDATGGLKEEREIIVEADQIKKFAAENYNPF